MIKTIQSFLCAVFFFGTVSLTAAPFVGSLKMKMNTSSPSKEKETSATMQMYLKGTKMAMKILDGKMGEGPQAEMMKNASFVIDSKENMMYTMMDMGGQKMGMKMDLAKISQNEKVKSASKEADLKYNPTGKNMTINGFKCSEYVGSNEKYHSTIWATSDFNLNSSDFYNSFSKSFGQSGMNADNYKNIKGFPIKTITSQKTDKTIVTSEVTEVSNVVPSDDIFSIEGYQFMDMSNMMPQK